MQLLIYFNFIDYNVNGLTGFTLPVAKYPLPVLATMASVSRELKFNILRVKNI